VPCGIQSRDQNTILYFDMQVRYKQTAITMGKARTEEHVRREVKSDVVWKRKTAYERSNPAPELIACKSFALRILSSVYIGSFNKLTQVLAVGNRSLSDPASRIANFGTSSLNPLTDRFRPFDERRG